MNYLQVIGLATLGALLLILAINKWSKERDEKKNRPKAEPLPTHEYVKRIDIEENDNAS